MSEAYKKLKKEAGYKIELRKEQAWTDELLKTGNLKKAAEAKRREERKIASELKLAENKYSEELRGIIKFVTEEFAIRAKEEDHDAKKYRSIADTMAKEGIPTAQKLFLELAVGESEHARRLRAVGGEIIAGLEKKLRLYKWTTT